MESVFIAFLSYRFLLEVHCPMTISLLSKMRILHNRYYSVDGIQIIVRR